MDTPPGTNKSYAQLFAETEKLKASRKKLKKALKKNTKKISSVSMLIAVIVTAAKTPTPNEGVGRVATGD
jgi:prefoldin subunit 5